MDLVAMRIDGAIPMNVAKAYGMPMPQRPAATPPAQPARIDPPAFAKPAPTAADVSETLKGLIGGTVPGQVEFAPGGPPTAVSDALPLYTRAADKIEAAVAVQLGRSIDIRG